MAYSSAVRIAIFDPSSASMNRSDAIGISLDTNFNFTFSSPGDRWPNNDQAIHLFIQDLKYNTRFMGHKNNYGEALSAR